VIGNYLADHWPQNKIAILHDNTTFGKGVAEEVKKNLNRRGVIEAVYQAYPPGKNNYAGDIADLQAVDVDVLFIGGYPTEIALMARAAGDRDYPVQLVAALGLTSEDFGLIAGPGAEGAIFTDHADPRTPRSSAGGRAVPSVRFRMTPFTLMAPFRHGRRRPSKPARWISRR
jgi:branched-chain amino acid transport system substrate-binding protein